MEKTIRVASWNIAGAHRIRSLERFDYADEEIEYFADCLKKIDADVICLQEAHTNDERSNASDIARLLGMPFVYNAVNSPSHIDKDFKLGNAILSKVELEHIDSINYPYPAFDLFFSDGRPAVVHHKMIQIYSYKNTMITNTQMLPLTVFGERYDSGPGVELAESIQDLLIDRLRSPLIFCGDINFDIPSDIYPKLYKSLDLVEALPDEITRPNKMMIKQTPDHILTSRDLKVEKADIITVEADHYLCYADIILN